MEKHDWRDGLLVRTPNWLGDVVMTFPALKQLKAMIPATCGLFVLCPKGIAPLLESMKGTADFVLPLSNAHAFPTQREWQKIRSLHAGACVIFNNSFRDTLAMKSTGVPRIYGASARLRSFLLTGSCTFPKRHDFVLNSPHHAAKYLSIAYGLGAPEWDGVMPEITPILPESGLSPEVRILPEDKELLILAAGAAYGDAKRWPADQFRQVAKWWIDRGGVAATVGSHAESPIAKEVLSGFPPESARMLAGKTTLPELILLLKRAKLCIANDSGVMHLAAALGTKGVAVFGPTDPVATSPVSKDWRIVFRKLACAPCFKRDCPKGTKECFAAVNADLVIQTAEELISK